MFDDLEHYLTGIMSTDRVDVIIRLINRLTVLVGVDTTTTFSQYSYGIPTDIDVMEELSRFDDALLDLVQSAFSELGVVLDEENLDSSSIPSIENMAMAFELVAEWEDADRLYGILSSADDREMAVAEVVAEINGDDSGTYAILIAGVSNDFFTNLLELVESNASADSYGQSTVPESLLVRIKKHFKGKPDSMVSTLIREGVFTYGLGYPFYLKFYENALYELEPKELVVALVDFAICSQAESSQISEVALAVIGNYAETIDEATKYQNLMKAYIATMPVSYGGSVVEAV